MINIFGRIQPNSHKLFGLNGCISCMVIHIIMYIHCCLSPSVAAFCILLALCTNVTSVVTLCVPGHCALHRLCGVRRGRRGLHHPHAHHRPVLLLLPLLWQMWRQGQPGGEEGRQMSAHLLRTLAGAIQHAYTVSSTTMYAQSG